MNDFPKLINDNLPADQQDIDDLQDEVSNCCGASIIENTDICSECKEHCDIERI